MYAFSSTPSSDLAPSAEASNFPHPEWSRITSMTIRTRKRRTLWNWLLVLPALGLAFPGIYSHAEPTLFGFPFFYWYQFAWVLGAAAISALVFFKTRD